MGILRSLFSGGAKSMGARDPRIQTIRFRKLLENANSLIGLLDDGREKLGGDYILDSHYVASLVDGITERLGMIVHDSCVLSPENSGHLHARYDEHKREAQGFLARAVRKNVAEAQDGGRVGENDHLEFPEYRLLSDVIDWCAKDSAGGSVIDLVRRAVVFGLHSLEASLAEPEIRKKGRCVETPAGGMIVMGLWSAGAGPDGGSSLGDLKECLPLKFLLMGVDEERECRQGDAEPRLVAMVDRDELSLTRLEGGGVFRIDANASGHRRADYVFLSAQQGWDAGHRLPDGFRIEETEGRLLAWMFDVPAKAIEDCLIRIGRALFQPG